jgi:hypothetical protein
VQATELQALARQPRRIAGAPLPRPSIDWFGWAIPGSAAIGAASFGVAAIALLLIADPAPPVTQLAFYAASSIAGFLAGLAVACRWASRRVATGRPWREGLVAGLVLAGATAIAFVGLRLGLGVLWPLPPTLLLAAAAGGTLIRRA